MSNVKHNTKELNRDMMLKMISDLIWFDKGIALNVSNDLQEVYC